MSKSHIEWLEEQCEPKKKPTEQDIFKEFEELGYHITKGLNSIKFYNNKNSKKIMIWNDKTYIANAFFTIKEHQLLHRLFEIWGWVDEKE